MRALFLFQIFSFQKSTIYLDLLRAVRNAGHSVTAVACTSEDVSDELQIIEGINVYFLKVEDQFGAGRIRKGLIQMSIAPKMKTLIKKRIWDEKFDIIVYPTPPITLAGVVDICRMHYGCCTYLMLKDIFPQNAVDLHMMRENGLIHRYFKKIERHLYYVSDRIGCMSEANIEYMREHNDSDVAEKLELFPNTVEIKPFVGHTDDSCIAENMTDPENPEDQQDTQEKVVSFVFGGNLGKPQAVGLLLDGIIRCRSDAHFTFVGDGSESSLVEEFVAKKAPKNFTYRHSMPRDEYEQLMKSADVGIVSLSSLFTIPNFPSRVLSYMQVGKPILAVTDRFSDVGRMVSEEAHCGWWCISDDPAVLVNMIDMICTQQDRFHTYGMNGRRYLEEHFDVRSSVKILEEAAD